MNQPKSAKRNKRTYRLWKLCETLALTDIALLIKHRREMIKGCIDPDEIRQLRTEIKVLEEAYRILKFRKSNECQ